jgi:hypothetical protein
MQDDNPYVPSNIPAVGDLFDMFNFGGGNQQGNQNEQAKQNQQGNQ